MKTNSRATSKEAKHGDKKMIEVKVLFWTNKLGGKRGHVLQKHAWSGGVVRMEANKLHGIRAGKPQPFHSLMDLTAVMEKVLIQHAITLHPSKKAKKYIEA